MRHLYVVREPRTATELEQALTLDEYVRREVRRERIKRRVVTALWCAAVVVAFCYGYFLLP